MNNNNLNSRVSSAGVLSGAFGSVFGILAIFSFALIFLPFSMAFTFLSFIRSIAYRSASGFCAFAASLSFSIIAVVVSPSAWVAIVALLGLNSHYTKQKLPDKISNSINIPEYKTNTSSIIPDASSLRPMQLDRLIFTLLPNITVSDPGNMVQSDSIIWTSHTSSTADGSIDHEGLARVRIGSMKAMREITNNDDANYKTSSKNSPKEEVLWRINYAISKKKPHDISFIEIDPNCLGYSISTQNDDACSFNFKKIEYSSLYKAILICSPKDKYDVAAVQRVYRLTATGKRDMLLRYLYDEGSGGGSSSIELVYPSKRNEACR